MSSDLANGASWGYAASVALTGWNPAFTLTIQLPIMIIVTLILVFGLGMSFGKSLLAAYLIQIPITLFLAKVGFDFFLTYFGLNNISTPWSNDVENTEKTEKIE